MREIDLEENYKFVRRNLSEAGKWNALAEEASELSAAASKMVRICLGDSPTPVSKEEAIKDVIEELSDVVNTLQVLQLDSDSSIIQFKLDRWVNRIKNKNIG